MMKTDTQEVIRIEQLTDHIFIVSTSAENKLIGTVNNGVFRPLKGRTVSDAEQEGVIDFINNLKEDN